MGWRTTGDVAAFLDEVGAFLRRERARNTVLLTVTEQLRVNQSRDADAGAADPAGLPLFGWWAGDGSEPGGAFYQRIGYRAVEDRVVLAFPAPEATGR